MVKMNDEFGDKGFKETFKTLSDVMDKAMFTHAVVVEIYEAIKRHGVEKVLKDLEEAIQGTSHAIRERNDNTYDGMLSGVKFTTNFLKMKGGNNGK